MQSLKVNNYFESKFRAPLIQQTITFITIIITIFFQGFYL